MDRATLRRAQALYAGAPWRDRLHVAMRRALCPFEHLAAFVPPTVLRYAVAPTPIVPVTGSTASLQAPPPIPEPTASQVEPVQYAMRLAALESARVKIPVAQIVPTVSRHNP